MPLGWSVICSVLATNFTARRNQPRPYGGKGRKPVYGEKIRPLVRRYKGKTIPASSPDRVETVDGSWRRDPSRDLGRPDPARCDPRSAGQDVPGICHLRSRLHHPLVAGNTPRSESGYGESHVPGSAGRSSRLPLSAKQMVGAHRQFVHADESIQRLPELALLAGSILSYLAATVPAAPTGFWDRQPRRTPGRFRRMLMGKPFPQSYPLPEQIRRKGIGNGAFAQGHPGPQAKIDRFSPGFGALKRKMGSIGKVLCSRKLFR